MHALVDGDGQRAVHARNVLNEPQHESMAPPGRIGVGCSLVRAGANLAEGGLDKGAGVGDEQAGAANLAHGRGDEMAQDELDIDIVVGKLRGQGVAPLLEEGLAARVCGQVRRGGPAAKRAHGQDKTALALLQDRGNNLGHLERAQAVDGDDALQLVAGGLEEGHGDAVALADIVDQDADVEALDKLGEAVVVGVVVLGKVHRKGLDLRRLGGKLGRDFAGEGIELRLGAGHEDEVEALGGELAGKLLAEAVRGAGDDGPGTGLAILAELNINCGLAFVERGQREQQGVAGARATYIGARQDKGAEHEAQVAKQLGGDKETADGGKEHQAAVRHRGQFAEIFVNLVHDECAEYPIV